MTTAAVDTVLELDTITTGYAGPVIGVATSPEGSQ